MSGLTRDANGNFNGQLFATTGTYFGAPWNPADGAGSALVGTASFQPTDAYTANLSYALDAGPTVVKVIQRQRLTSIPLGGSYNGTQAGSLYDRPEQLCLHRPVHPRRLTTDGQHADVHLCVPRQRLELHFIRHIRAAGPAL
jgi:hypothetical protein